MLTPEVRSSATAFTSEKIAAERCMQDFPRGNTKRRAMTKAVTIPVRYAKIIEAE
jgi:hypothetical protein